MSPVSRDIYTQQPRPTGLDATARPRPWRVWWNVSTPAERAGAWFVAFSILALFGILIGLAVYQYRELTYYRRRPVPAADEMTQVREPPSRPAETGLDPDLRLILDEMVSDVGALPPLLASTAPADLTPKVIQTAAVHLRRAERAEAEDDWVAALNGYEQALKVFPESRRLRELVGLCHLRMGDYARAEEAFEQLTSRWPALAGLWNNLGVARAGREQYDEAREAFRRAVELDAAYLLARRNLALLHYRLGELEAATGMLANLLRQNPDDAEIGLTYAAALVRQRRWAEAAAVLENMAQQSPSAPVWFYLAGAHSNLGQNGVALQALDRAVAMVDHPTARRWLERPELAPLRGEAKFRQLLDRLSSAIP